MTPAATPATSAATQFAKGSTLRSTHEFVVGQFGDVALGRALDRLSLSEREQIARAVPTDEIPYPLLLAFWSAADAELSGDNPDWMERSGAHAIDSLGVQLYGGILRKTSPTEFLTQRVSLFRLYYQPGNMEVVEDTPGRAVLRLVGFDAADPLFCRRQTGGLVRSLEIAGGRDAAVAHCRCSLEGDAFCEWELTWR
jgi:hypothetical protein